MGFIVAVVDDRMPPAPLISLNTCWLIRGRQRLTGSWVAFDAVPCPAHPAGG